MVGEPRKYRDLERLAPVFRYPFEAWLQEAQRVMTHIELRVNETRRYSDRQAYLYKQGREDPYKDRPKVTWAKESLHQWGLAADWFFVRRDLDGRPIESAVWDTDSYKWIYRVVPPGPYGLKTIEGDYVHLEHIAAADLIRQAAALSLYRA